jgi:alginate O-acetyltransferase complex protein AlgI
MSFISFTFYIYLGIVLIVYWSQSKKIGQNLVLLVASFGFYSLIDWRFSVFLGLAILVDYFLIKKMQQDPENKQKFFEFSLGINLGALLIFKYFGFFTDSILDFFEALGLQGDLTIIKLAVPIGISFYTLKKIGYMTDFNRGTLRRDPELIDFALYISFFPQILSGPIEAHRRFLPQIDRTRRWASDNFYQAWPLLVMGLFKKIVIADNIKIIVDQIYRQGSPSKFLFLVGTLAFSLQILMDFSAYTDISRGIAYLFGIETSKNFDRPYLALTPTQFWDRWHITLSDWLRDYVFFPARRTFMRKYRHRRNLSLLAPPMLTMLVSGFWHGVGWNFIVWGGFHGLIITIYQLLGFSGNWKPNSRVKGIYAHLVMLIIIIISWAFFRASSLTWLSNVLLKSPWIVGQKDLLAGMVGLAFTIFYSALIFLKYLIDRFSPENRWLQGFYLATVTVLSIVYANSGSPDFIYVQF